MKNFWFGFFVSVSICLTTYIVWEHIRHVPVVIQQVPMPVPMSRDSEILPEPVPNTNALRVAEE
jgi:hypothetical protein